jgi:HEAT repeat protein
MTRRPNTFVSRSATVLTALALGLLAALQALARERDSEAAKEAALGHSADLETLARPARMPDLTKGEPLPPPGKDGPVTWNMGPVGIVGIKNGGNKGDQVQVVSVVPGSPAGGKVLPGDVLLGVQGRRFVVGGDMNRIVGNAIIDAETEAGKGDLTIQLWRDRNWIKRTGAKDVFAVDLDKMFKEAEGTADIYEWETEEARTVAVKQMAFDEFPIDGVYTNIALKLQVMGTYSETSPWDCPVVQKVRDNALKVIAARITPSRRKRGKLGGSWPDVLALVASGRPEYVSLAKKWVHEQELCQDMEGRFTLADVTYRGMQSWHHGFGYLEMAIYYDATGDEYVLPEIRKRAIVAALGQNGGGSWGHTFAFREFNGGMLHKCNPGYGAMNNAGGRCFFLLTLAKKAGIDHPEINAAIWRADRFFRTFVDKGCIPYGYHSPYGSDDSNGKNYGPAYAFYTLGRKYAAKYFSMHSAHASFTRRGGHGSPTLWYYTPLSAHMAGPKAVQAYMRNMRYFYTLSRRHDGSFIFLGEQSPGIGGKGMRNATAYVTMHLSAPLKQLMITGRDADENFWTTDEELEELLVSARGNGKRGQIGDDVLLEMVGKPWPERDTNELIELLDHFYPNMRRALAAELGKRYAAGEKDILEKILPLLGSDEPRMRDGACKTLSACGVGAALASLSKVVPMLKDESEFVRMQAAKTIGGATQPGEEKRELELLKATVDEYPGMTMDNGNVRNAIKGVLFPRRRRGSPDGAFSKLGTTPFQAQYDEELVRLAMEKIVTMDPQGTVPGDWDKEALLKLAGPVTFAAAERQVNDAMFGGARKDQGQALLRKHGYREAVEGDAFNLIQRSILARGVRRGVGYKDAFITPMKVKQAPGLYRGVLDELRLWQLDNPTLVLSESMGKGKPPILTPLNQLIEIVEKDTDNRVLPTIGPDVAEMFQSELAAAGDGAAQLALCRKELDNLERKNYFRKMYAMSHLAGTLGTKTLDDVSPFLGHEHWRVREHAERVALDLVKQGAGERLVELFQEAQARESGLLGNWNAAGILDALVAAQHESALETARSALKHDDPLVRRAAVRAVFTIGGDADLKTVFAFMRTVAEEREDYDGCELALLSKRDDPAHVQRVSKAAIALLPRSKPPLRRSLAWVLGQFGGEANLAAIQQAAETTEDDADLKEMALALAYSPDRAASENVLALVKVSKRVRDVVAPLAIHRMVGRNGMGDVSDKERVRFARGILNLTYNDRFVSFLSRVHTGQAIQLLYDVMKMNPETSAKSIIASAEGIRLPTKLDSQIASEVLADVIEYIEVTHLRGGMTEQVQDWRESMGYMEWKGLQARAGQALLKFHKPDKVPIPEFDDIHLDL